MLTLTELLSLAHELQDRRVLSVYLDGTLDDPARRQAWRIQVTNGIDDVRRWLEDSPHAEREGFERCVARLTRLLDALDGAVRAPGWVTFITEDGVHLAQRLPAPTPTVVVWSTGICEAPYLRALEQHRVAVLTLVDHVHARVYRYRRGELTLLETLHAHANSGPPTHMGDAPRQGFHAGVRGSTGRETSQRAALIASDRLLDRTALAALSLAGTDGWLLVGGVPEARTALTLRLAERAPTRVLAMTSLDVHATEAQVAAAAALGASTLRDDENLRRIAAVIEAASAGGCGALGVTETQRALDERRVRTLLLSGTFLEAHAVDAERAVREALAQGADVEELARDAGRRLDRHGGIAALLRWSDATHRAPAMVR